MSLKGNVNRFKKLKGMDRELVMEYYRNNPEAVNKGLKSERKAVSECPLFLSAENEKQQELF